MTWLKLIRYNLINRLRIFLMESSESSLVRKMALSVYLFIAYFFALCCYVIPSVKSVYAKGSWAEKKLQSGFSDIDLALITSQSFSFTGLHCISLLKKCLNFFTPLIGEIEIINEQVVNQANFGTYLARFTWRRILGQSCFQKSFMPRSRNDVDDMFFFYAYHLCQNYLYGRHPFLFERMAKRFYDRFFPSVEVEMDSSPEVLMRSCQKVVENALVDSWGSFTGDLASHVDLLFFSPIYPYLPGTRYCCHNIVLMKKLLPFAFMPAVACRYNQNTVTTHPIQLTETMARAYLARPKDDGLDLSIAIFSQWRGVFANDYIFQAPNQDGMLTLIGWLDYLSQRGHKVEVAFSQWEELLGPPSILKSRIYAAFQRLESDFVTA